MNRSLRKFIDSISIKTTVIILFVLSITLTVGAIGYSTFTKWNDSNEKIITRLADNLNKDLANQIEAYLHIPKHIIEMNQGMLDDGVVDMEDPDARNLFFLNILKTQDDIIYSFSYGSEAGEYYGARRNESGDVEFMVNNEETGGNSWYYSANDNGTLGEFSRDVGSFDPRTRAWYKAAISQNGFSFSPTYKHFVMNDLSISAAAPVMVNSDELDGVLGVHLLHNAL